MKKIGLWVKNNKLAAFLAIFFFALAVKDFLGSQTVCQASHSSIGSSETSMVAFSEAGKSATLLSEREAFPSESKEHSVVQTWSLSLAVNDARQVSKEVINYTQEIDGFMVSASLFLNKKGEKITPVADWLVVKLAPAREHFTSSGRAKEGLEFLEKISAWFSLSKLKWRG